jgi:hypothetical protein
MEEQKLKVLELTLSKLKDKMLEDEDMKSMFSKHFPELDYDSVVERTIAQMYDYAVSKDYDILDLSLDGVRAFFESVFDTDEQEDEDEDKGYGDA